MSTVKIDPSDKEILKNLQAKLKLQANLKFDQYRLLGQLIKFGDIKYHEFLSFIEKTSLNDDEIKELETTIINHYSHKYPDKSDDELIYRD